MLEHFGIMDQEAVPTEAATSSPSTIPIYQQWVSSWMAIAITYYMFGIARFWFRSEEVWSTCIGDFAIFHQTSSRLRRSQITLIGIIGPMFVSLWPVDIILSILWGYVMNKVQGYFFRNNERKTAPVRSTSPPPAYAAVDSRNFSAIEEGAHSKKCLTEDHLGI